MVSVLVNLHRPYSCFTVCLSSLTPLVSPRIRSIKPAIQAKAATLSEERNIGDRQTRRGERGERSGVSGRSVGGHSPFVSFRVPLARDSSARLIDYCAAAALSTDRQGCRMRQADGWLPKTSSSVLSVCQSDMRGSLGLRTPSRRRSSSTSRFVALSRAAPVLHSVGADDSCRGLGLQEIDQIMHDQPNYSRLESPYAAYNIKKRRYIPQEY